MVSSWHSSASSAERSSASTKSTNSAAGGRLSMCADRQARYQCCEPASALPGFTLRHPRHVISLEEKWKLPKQGSARM